MCSADFPYENGSTSQLGFSIKHFEKWFLCLLLCVLSLITSAQNTILRFWDYIQVIFRMLLTYDTALITSAKDIGDFYRIFTFRSSFRTLFDTQLMNFIWKYVFLIKGKICTLIFNSYCAERKQTPIDIQFRMMKDWRSRNKNLHRMMNGVLMTFQRKQKSIYYSTNMHMGFKTESIRKLSNFNFSGKKPKCFKPYLIPFYTFQGL